jgi:hypothetical protein
MFLQPTKIQQSNDKAKQSLENRLKTNQAEACSYALQAVLHRVILSNAQRLLGMRGLSESANFKEYDYLSKEFAIFVCEFNNRDLAI